MKRAPAFATGPWCPTVAVAILLVLAACSTDQQTGPSGTPAHVIRAYPNACVPQVVSSITDSTQTDLVTFDSIVTSPCYPNLIAWGIDMADPVGVDTPQGSAAWQMYNTAAVNLPSGAFYARSELSGGQNMIEFDPPVSSVSFYYSRLQNDRARWGGQLVSADSMMVYARSRIPGTTFYDDWDSQKLYSNVPSTTPPWSVWTEVTLSANSDKIEWLWFDGNLVLDNLRITRKPLSCTGARRGQQATCRVTPSGATVTSWEFVPDSSYGSLPAVQETTSDTVWSGVVAASGMVTVHLTDGVTIRAFRTHLSVTDRSWAWPSTWAYRVGTAAELTTPDAEPDTGVVLGRNCPDTLPLPCTDADWILPDPMQFGAGIAAANIPNGPNNGYWFVDSATWYMHRVGNIIPGLLPSSLRTHTLTPPVPNQCRHALGFGKNDTVFTNFNLYNDKCQGVDMGIFVAAALGHEGYGYNGGRGHQFLAEAAAAQPGNDPYAAVDSIVYTDSSGVLSLARAAVTPITVRIRNAAADSLVGGNYPPSSLWFWRATASAYQMQNISGF